MLLCAYFDNVIAHGVGKRLLLIGSIYIDIRLLGSSASSGTNTTQQNDNIHCIQNVYSRLSEQNSTRVINTNKKVDLPHYNIKVEEKKTIQGDPNPFRNTRTRFSLSESLESCVRTP